MSLNGRVEMQFESKIKRLYWINSFLGLIPDLAIAVIITAIFGGYLGTFILIMIGLQVLYFLVWLRKSIWGWIVFGVFGRKYLAGVLADYLAENNYPEPEVYERSAEEYFNRIAGDEALPFPLRLKAVGQAAALHVPTTIGQYQYGFHVAMAYEDAISAYKRSAAGKKPNRSSEQFTSSESLADREDTSHPNALDELNMHCEYHLLHVANFEDAYWQKADQEHDLRGVLVAYFAAIDGTRDAVNTMFKPYEDKIERSDRSGIFNRIKLRKLNTSCSYEHILSSS
jgi:hypothetical protein